MVVNFITDLRVDPRITGAWELDLDRIWAETGGHRHGDR